MDNLLVDGGANGTGESAIALEGGDSAFKADDVFDETVQLACRDARGDYVPNHAEGQRAYAAGLPHGLNFLRRL